MALLQRNGRISKRMENGGDYIHVQTPVTLYIKYENLSVQILSL